jgi:cyclophilin family peptidyl-prolyl cis-trans isomerase
MKKAILILTVLFMAFQQTGFSQSKPQSETLVLIKTSYGNITAKLYNDTPQHRDNFIKLIKEGWYNGSPFHRIIKGFMIQGGSNKDGRQDPGYTIPAEILPNHLHKKGALAAARQGDNVNPQKASSGSQFYIVEGTVLTNETLDSYEKRYNVKYSAEQRKAYTTVGGTPWLDGGYTVFGEVVSGLDVVDKIASVPTGPGDKPVTPVTMTIEIVK